MKRKILGETGITLLALVITIVIIIILATITINMALGDNGLVEKAEQAKNMVEESSKKEQEELSNAAVWLNEVIYGEGGNTGTNEEVPGSNNTDTNGIDTNTIQPPPIEIPDGNEEGAIIFGSPTWTAGKANVTISTETEYKIEYQINKTEEESWKELSLEQVTKQGIVTDINHNDTIYARLTDGENYGEYASITIKDTITPQKASINLGVTSAMVGQTITATVTHTDNETGVDIGKCKWVFNTNSTNIGTDEKSYTGGTFSSNGETISIPTTEAGEYYLHVLTVDKAGNKIETVSNKITVNEIAGSINKEGETTWSNGTASIVVSTEEKDYTIEYKINEGEWVRLEDAPGEDGNTGTKGTIPGLEHGDIVHVRLTNGEQTGEETTFEIEDATNPRVTVTEGAITTNSIAVSVSTSDNESGMASAINYIYYIKKSSEQDTAYVQKQSNNTNTYTFTGLEQGTSYDIKVEAIGDKAGNKGTGTLLNQTTATLPGGDGSIEGGQITFGKPNWKAGTASVTVTTNTSYKMQYQVNGMDEGSWKEITSGGSITGLKYKDKVNVRLTDGNNYGEPASTTVTDEVTPGKASITFESNEVIVGDNVVATVTHVDNESGEEISKCKWVFNTISTNIGTDEGSYTGTFTKNGEKLTIPTSTVGTYYLHVLTVDKAGNKVETISEVVTLKKVEGRIEFGAPTWQSGTASIKLSTTEESYKIQYKINDGSWKNLEDLGGSNTATSGTVSGLNNKDVLYARLTNGTQYGEEVNTTIKDSTAPKVTLKVTPTTNSITVNAESTDNETGLANNLTYTYYIKQTSEPESSYVLKDTHSVDNSENNSTVADNYTFTGLTQGTSYDIKVEVIGDKAGNKGTGTVTGQITESLPGGEEGLEQGAISFGSITWSGGTASVPVSTNTSFTIEYQVAAGEPTDEDWKTITGGESVTGINHNETIYARLTDGINYGEYASMTIKDTQIPALEISQDEVTDKSITVTANAVDNETGLVEVDTYKFYLDNVEKATTIETTYTFEELTAETKYSIKVEAFDKAGNVATQTVDITTLEEQGMSAGDIASKPIEYYGAEVINYDMDVPSAGVDKWRIFYADDTNIYLIADDYISHENIPDGQNGSHITYGIGDLAMSFDDVIDDYSGANWISSNSKGAKWLSQYLSKNGSSTNVNIRAVAYMMDTNVWSAYYASEDAEYAMGGPTLEMFCASYKDTHPSKYLECGNLSSYGYNVRWNGGSWSDGQDGLVKNDFNSIYIKSNIDGMWLASPSAVIDSGLMYAGRGGSLSYYDYDYSYYGLRPIVCLKSDTKLEKLDDGTFQIVKTPKPPVKADEISKVPILYYGREVTNYTAPHEGVDKWRIFYADDTNVYLIADDYILAENAPTGQSGSIISETGYHPAFDDVYKDYTGASWISGNSKGSKWLSQYLSKDGSSTNINIRAVAYMMDTNVWSAYYASEDAEYAMGGPTLEMFCASHKDTHVSKYLECGNVTSAGYKVGWNAGSWGYSANGLVQDEFNSIYIKSSTSKSDGMWLASPSANHINKLMYADYNGYVSYDDYYISSYGLRPLVCLKSGVQLQKQVDGTVMIVK